MISFSVKRKSFQEEKFKLLVVSSLHHSLVVLGIISIPKILNN